MVDEADLVAKVCAVNLLFDIEREQIAQLLMLINGTASFGLLLGDNLAFVFTDEVMLTNILACVETKTMNTAVSQNDMLGNSSLNVGVPAIAIEDPIVVAIAGVEDIANTTVSAKIWIALSAELKAHAFISLKADHPVPFLVFLGGTTATLELPCAVGRTAARLFTREPTLETKASRCTASLARMMTRIERPPFVGLEKKARVVASLPVFQFATLTRDFGRLVGDGGRKDDSIPDVDVRRMDDIGVVNMPVIVVFFRFILTVGMFFHFTVVGAIIAHADSACQCQLIIAWTIALFLE